MQWTPLALTTPIRNHVFGGRRITERLGRPDLPDGQIAETWEVSDVDEDIALVLSGPFAGRSLRELVTRYPQEIVGRGWRGPHFPVLTKFIDGQGMLPVHLHADDRTARKLEMQPNGKTEAWHILDAPPGTTALVGLQDGVDKSTLRDALLRQDWDSVMRRLPLSPGDTIYVPGGTLHSFGPDTLIYEIEQTSNIQQHAMPWRMEDGSEVGPVLRRKNIEMLLLELRPEPQPEFRPGLRLPTEDGVERTFCVASPFFALDRWKAEASQTIRRSFDHALILSNIGPEVGVRSGSWAGQLGPAKSLLLPAALGHVEIDGPAEVLMGWLPDLERDVRQPLRAAGHAPELLAGLGELLTDERTSS